MNNFHRLIRKLRQQERELLIEDLEFALVSGNHVIRYKAHGYGTIGILANLAGYIPTVVPTYLGESECPLRISLIW